MKNNIFLFAILSLFLLFFFFLDISMGSVKMGFDEIFHILSGNSSNTSRQFILFNYRLPKAVTALCVGAGISLCGLQMQTLFRNPLADTSILGIGSGASLGVALFVMLGAIFPSFIPSFLVTGYWGLIISAIIGALVILIVISIFITWLSDLVSILIIGVMFGYVTSSLVSIMQYFSSPETVKSYLIWSFGSLGGTTWDQLYYIIPIIGVSLFLSFLLPKSMNALLLGENYARSVGVNINLIRIKLVLLTALITGTLTAFVGPIAFIGIAVPHAARMVFKTTNHLILIPATIFCGMLIMLICDIVTQLPSDGVVLPINAVTSILGAPVVVIIILRRRRNKSIFN